MSKYMTFPEARFKSLALLMEALSDLGWRLEQIEYHEQPQALVGFEGQNRPERANVIIRRKDIGSLSNDIGFELRDGAYVPVVSEYDLTYLHRRRLGGREFVPALRTAYNTRVAQRVATRLRGTTTQSQVGGTRRVVVSY